MINAQPSIDLEARYTDYYSTEKGHDSPRDSRVRMTSAMTSFILAGEGQTRVLDIGSGRRELEGTLHRNALGNHDKTLARRLAETQLVSFDIADIPARRLNKPHGLHVRADSRAMPFRDATFDLTVSNHSIDMLRWNKSEYETALQEAARVTKPDGTILFNFHPAELFDDRSRHFAKKGGVDEAFYHGNECDNPYYQSEEQIAEEVTAAGIELVSIKQEATVLTRSKRVSDLWWEVVGRRAA